MNTGLSQSGNVITLRADGISAGDTIPLMLTSDWHYDSVSCDRALLTKHLTRANDKGAVVLVAGDVFDAMSGKFDPRRSYDGLRAEYKVEDYFDAITLDAIDFLSQFSHCKFVLAMGNHETAVLKNNSVCLTDRVAMGLRDKHKMTAYGAGYYGWLRVLTKDGQGRGRFPKKVYWHHGSGGNAPVTRGVIATNRQAVYIRNADIILNGHNHQNYHVAIKEYGLTNRGVEYVQIVDYIRTPGYNIGGLESGDTHGYGIEKHPEPLPRGSVFVDMVYTRDGLDAEILVKVE